MNYLPKCYWWREIIVPGSMEIGEMEFIVSWLCAERYAVRLLIWYAWETVQLQAHLTPHRS